MNRLMRLVGNVNPFDGLDMISICFPQERKEPCPECTKTGKENFLKYSYVNLEEAIYKCESPACLYPFRNFKYKNFADRTIFRYERITQAGDNRGEEKIFTSPTKVETNVLDEFNISWLGDTNTDDLDSIISAPSDAQTCDMKDIMNSLCSDMETTRPLAFSSPARNGDSIISQSPQSTAPRLSRCLQYIEHISPTKETGFNSKSKTPVRRTLKPISVDSIVPYVEPPVAPFKKVRSNKSRPTRPVQSIVEQQPLNFLEWLDVVSKTEPKQIQELEFASTNNRKDSSDSNNTNTNRSTSNTDPLSESNNVQPILIELISTPESLGSSNTKPCLLYKLDHSRLEPSNSQLKAITNDHHPVVVQSTSCEDHVMTDSSQDHVDVNPSESNVERSSFVTEDSRYIGSKSINTELGVNSCGWRDHTVTNSESAMIQLQHRSKTEIVKEEAKSERNEKMKLERRRDRILQVQAKRNLKVKALPQLRKEMAEQIARNQKHFNIEIEESFLGFEAVGPYKPIALRKNDLIWCRPE